MHQPVWTSAKRWFAFAFAILTLVCTNVARADILISGFTAATNDRFTNSSSLFADGYDFSGVARTTNNGRWGTLISPNAVLTANHFRPGVSSTFEFYPGNDPNVAPYEAVVTGGTRVGSTDLYISFLDRNVDPSIRVYDYVTESISGTPPMNGESTITAAGSLSLERAIMFGQSPVGRASTQRAIDQAIGENLIDGYVENIVFSTGTDNDSILLERDLVNPNDPLDNSGVLMSTAALPFEAYLQGGDSGGPAFIIDGMSNDLVLLGINSFIDDGSGPIRFSGIGYTGNQASTIASILSANAIAVPEPSGLAIFAIGILGIVSHRRKRAVTPQSC